MTGVEKAQVSANEWVQAIRIVAKAAHLIADTIERFAEFLDETK